MQDAKGLSLNPPIQYNIVWLLIGLAIVLLIASWYGVLFWMTRRKKLKSLNNLKRLPTGSELERLKAKYLALIEAIYQRHIRQEITLRDLHQALSSTVRQFAAEASHFPAPFLTLSDLKVGPYPALTDLIADYYPKEFAMITSGDALSSTNAAKGVVSQWSL